ncbi:MAG: DUF177 domain-containing protein [Ardenticatenaceae bacterium]|nr:DUF177 domain-containing protein [Ardenticatenaceae bacterium]
MSTNNFPRLRFNFGFLLESSLGTSRVIELDYPTIQVSEDVTLTPLQGRLTATRTSEGVYVNGRFQSAILTECVRCLDETLVPIDIEMDELFYYPPETMPQNEDAFAFDGETGFIDLGPLMRELSLLALPTQPLCRPDCLGLCMECGQNLNEGDCNCQDDDIDPRMAKLRSLLE